MPTDEEFETRLNLRDSNVARASEIAAAVKAAVSAARDDDKNSFAHAGFTRRIDTLEKGHSEILEQLEKYNRIMNRWMGGFFVLTVVGAFLTWIFSSVAGIKGWFVK